MNDFARKYGPWALVTGASAGLGEAFARQLAGQGVNLVLLARRAERLQELGRELESQHGVQTRAVAADLSRPDFLAAVVAQTADLDIGLLVNNAGFTNSGHFLDNDLDAEVRLVDVNCRAAVMLAHHYGRLMRERRRGGIIFLASIAGFSAIPFWANYAASKAFDLHLAEGLGAELQKYGVDVLAVCPGATRTEFATYRGPLSAVLTQDAEPVVRGALRQLGRRRFWVSGPLNRMNSLFTRLLPRRLSAVLFGVVVRDIVEH